MAEVMDLTPEGVKKDPARCNEAADELEKAVSRMAHAANLAMPDLDNFIISLGLPQRQFEEYQDIVAEMREAHGNWSQRSHNLMAAVAGRPA
jgi:endonuclease III